MALTLSVRDDAWLREHQRYVPCPRCGCATSSMTLSNTSRGIAYVCRDCGLRHGAHQDTGEPLGEPAADEDTRRARMDAHEALDRLWGGPGAVMTRSEAYALLAERMGLPVERCHISRFDAAQCRRVVEICEGSP